MWPFNRKKEESYFSRFEKHLIALREELGFTIDMLFYGCDEYTLIFKDGNKIFINEGETHSLRCSHLNEIRNYILARMPKKREIILVDKYRIVEHVNKFYIQSSKEYVYEDTKERLTYDEIINLKDRSLVFEYPKWNYLIENPFSTLKYAQSYLKKYLTEPIIHEVKLEEVKSKNGTQSRSTL